ncbi:MULTISPECIES: OmpA family protein [Mesorhizobium]|uniref:OmpA family protein n=1 Tax=Mesorhizobium denitrificans TaxID=2294114 RepID=A0A371XBS7_9HYPH|nr:MULTISPECIES: OmpA family protein [Mesorhizobium]RFC66669.1 OmpA family protein [Mesorhizobium denitrificans]
MRGLERPVSVLFVFASLALAGCVSGGGAGVDDRSFIGKGWDSLTGLVGRDREQRDSQLIDAGVDAVGKAETDPYMDRQDQELRKQLDGKPATISRAGDQLVVTMPTAELFDTNKSTLKRSSLNELNGIAAVLKKNERTTIDVYGHTDSGGDEKKNLDLTQQRALAVARHLASQGVDARRLSVTGFGSSRPAGADGNVADRRIEIQISPIKKR